MVPFRLIWLLQEAKEAAAKAAADAAEEEKRKAAQKAEEAMFSTYSVRSILIAH